MFYALSKTTAKVSDALKPHYLSLLLLFFLTAVTFNELPSHSFLNNWDDPLYVTDNPAVRGFNLLNLKAAFTGFFVGNYSPVQIISYMTDYTLWGMNPAYFILSNIFYHFTNSLLLYFLLIRKGISRWGAALGSAVFLLHPVQVESVAWISQRKNLLSMTFFLISFHSYLSYFSASGKTAKKSYALSFTSFLLALLAKPVAVIFPIILIIQDHLETVKEQNIIKRHKDKIPYFAVAGIMAVITIMIQSPVDVGGRVEYPENAWLVLPMTMLPVLVTYLHNILLPSSKALSIIYSVPLKHNADWILLFSVLVVIFLIFTGIYFYRRNRSLLFWYATFFIALLPVSQVVPLVTMMNDRYLYFPMIGIAGITGCLTGIAQTKIQTPSFKIMLTLVATVVIAWLAFESYQRGKVWKNSVTLFSDAAQKTPDDFRSLLGLAEGYRAAGNLEMAVNYYEDASRYGYLPSEASFGLARIYLDKTEPDKAYSHIISGLLKSGETKAGMLLLGEYNGMKGNYSDAEQQLLSYLESVPDSKQGLFLLGKVYFMSGKNENARKYYQKALDYGAKSAELYLAYACLESEAGKSQKAVHLLQEYVKAENSNIKTPGIDGYSCFSTLKNNPEFKSLLNQ
ncbi:MAG: tetratricopeptide repeat protein [Desulfuromonadaceae bacterium]|nr:tetratricopeptide repeat protein [Desulfuromonadaceae bacterium]MDD2854330.1 tetratricopeptide repeat protein [Desulfuromonadaceae bacterium]